MAESEELKSVKKTIRSLLISVKEGLTVRDVEEDFLTFEGMKLPFAKFGFQNARSFLQSLKDVVYFFTDHCGVEKMKQVSDESTLHIEKLVARQKTDTRKRKGGRAPLTRSALQSFSNRGRRGGGGRRGQSHPFANFASYQSKKPSLNNSSQNTGNRWASSGPAPQPPRFYRSNSRHSNSSNDGVQEGFSRTGSGMTSSSSRETVQKGSHFQKGNVQQSRSVQAFSTNRREPDGLPSRGPAAVERPTKPGSINAWNSGLAVGASRVSRTDAHSNQPQPPVRYTVDSDSGSEFDYFYDPPENNAKVNQMSMREEDCIITKGVQDKIKQVLAKAPKGLWAKRLPVMYKQMFKQELPVKDFDCLSVIEFVAHMPHLVRTVRPYENGDWLLSDATSPEPEHEVPANMHQHLASQMNRPKQTLTWGKPSDGSGDGAGAERCWGTGEGDLAPYRTLQEFRESVRQVLEHQPEGVLLHHFVAVYEEMTGHPMDPLAYGYDGMPSLLLALAEAEVLCMNFDGKDSTVLVAVNKTGLRRFDLLKDAFKPHSQQGLLTTSMDLPPGVVGHGRCFPPATMMGMVKGGECEVHVSSTISPSLLWLQRRLDIGDLDDLMDSLEEVYSVDAGKLRMPVDMMLHGQVCAVLYEDNNWHRGIITNIKEDGLVSVYYVDYGNTGNVDQATVCYLKEQFLSLPVQAMQAKLAFLLPVDETVGFTKETSAELYNMVVERPLFARIADIENMVLSVVLMDTSGPKHIVINDQLADMGLAKFITVDTAATTQENGASASAGVSDGVEDHQGNKPAAPFYGEGRRYVRLMEFCPEIEFHVVYYGGEVLVMSSQISALFWEEDCLAYMLQQSKQVVGKVIMSKQQYPALFEELARRGAHCSMDEDVKTLHFYKLESLPFILDLFGDQSQLAEDLKKYVKHYLATFDHNDPYWKGMDEESVSGGTSEYSGTENENDIDPEEILTLEDLQLALHTMQINRKRILRRMTQEPECVKETVRELEAAEDNITMIQELLASLENSNTKDLRMPLGAGKSLPSSTSSLDSMVASSGPAVPQESFLYAHQAQDAHQPTTAAAAVAAASAAAAAPRNAVIKTNVVTPMVKPGLDISISTPGGIISNSGVGVGGMGTVSASRLPATSELLPENLELMDANRRLIEEIQRKDRIISSMLGVGSQGLGFPLPAPAPWGATPAAGLASDSLLPAGSLSSGVLHDRPPQDPFPQLAAFPPSQAPSSKPQGRDVYMDEKGDASHSQSQYVPQNSNSQSDPATFPQQARHLSQLVPGERASVEKTESRSRQDVDDAALSSQSEGDEGHGEDLRQAESPIEDDGAPGSNDRSPAAQSASLPTTSSDGVWTSSAMSGGVQQQPPQQLISPTSTSSQQPLPPPPVSVYLPNNVSQPLRPSVAGLPQMMMLPGPGVGLSQPPNMSVPPPGCSRPQGSVFMPSGRGGVGGGVYPLQHKMPVSGVVPASAFMTPNQIRTPIMSLPVSLHHAQAPPPPPPGPMVPCLPYRGSAGGSRGVSLSASVPGVHPMGSPPPPGPISLQHQLAYLQQRQMALQQQAMMRPRMHTPQPAAPVPTPAPGGLLPGMMPLLQSFQQQCTVGQQPQRPPLLPPPSAGPKLNRP